MGFWIVGIIFTDRWAWSQWLSWIPSLFVIFLLIVSIVANTYAKNIKTLFLIAILLFITLDRFVTNENSLFAKNESSGDLRLVGWTMSHSKKHVSKESAEEVIRLGGDITLLTHGWHVRGEPSIKKWLGNGQRVINGPFTILTKLKVLEVRALVASDGIYISMFVIDASESLGKPLILWAIDLPFDLGTPRIKTAERTIRLLSSIEVPKPDIVMGDFNMSRNSFSIKTMFPNLVDASDGGGKGLLASFPMQMPIYHIDHVLVGNGLVCDSYTLVNPHIGRHRVQIAELSAEK